VIRPTAFIAIAAVCLSAPVHAAQVTCESTNRQRVECDMNTQGEARMVQRLSKAACVEGQTYGFNRNSVWVEGGCRAVFAEDPQYAGGGRSQAPARSNGPADEQIAACDAVEDRYGQVVSSSPLKPGAWEIILQYPDGQYVCNVDANNRVSYFEPMKRSGGASRGGDGRGDRNRDDSGNNTAVRAGQGDFDSRAQVSCAQRRGQPMGQCQAGVARGYSGDATVVITRPDGRTRAIFFENGNAISADSSQADGYGEFRARKESDLYIISVGEERYEFPEAFVFGG
jgi:hypothetical protein